MKFDPTSFDGFLKLFGKNDIEEVSKFKDSYGHFLNINGILPTYTLGFHFTLDEEDGHAYNPTEILKTFSPSAIYVGDEDMKNKIDQMGFSSVVVPFFESGGFVVVASVPSSLASFS